MDDHNFLGRGGYGTVVKRGNIAVKKLKQLNHLIQEYCVGLHLNSCPYIVKIVGADFENLEIHMKLYNGSLNQWILESRSFEQKLKVLREILYALCWINDMGLVHGDIKPGNILANWDKKGNVEKLVLGDVGFLSTENYSKCVRTTRTYQEKSPESDWKHDIYSLGIIVTEFFGNTRVASKEMIRNKEIPSPDHARSIAKEKIKDENILKWVIKMLNDDREERPTARSLLKNLFDETPMIQFHPGICKKKNKINEKDLEEILCFFKTNLVIDGREIIIKRTKIAFEAFLIYIDKNNIAKSDYMFFANCILIIFSSLFGKSGYTDKIVSKKFKITERTVHRTIYRIINEEEVLNAIFYTKKGCISS